MLPLFPQELPTSCVSACVRMVLTGLGHRLSETDIRHSTDQVVVHDPLHDEGPRSIGISVFEAAWSAADRETVIIRPGPTG